MRKVVRDNVLSNNKVTDYANGFQYLDNVIQHFPTAEGYASRLNLRQENGVVALLPSTELPVDFFTYVYNYTDHLGNIRLSYARDPDTQQLKIVEQNHYYPFGLRHTNYSGGKMQVVKEQELKRMAPTPEELLSYKYKYNGKEWQDELGLNMYDYFARGYDPSIARFTSIDPLTELSRRCSTYMYCYNNPLIYVDPDGMLTKSFLDELMRKSTGDKTTWSFDQNGTASGSNGETIENNEDQDPPNAAKPNELNTSFGGLFDNFKKRLDKKRTITANNLADDYERNERLIMAFSFVMEALLETTEAGELLTYIRESIVDTYGDKKTKEVSEIYSNVISIVKEIKNEVGGGKLSDPYIYEFCAYLGVKCAALQIKNQTIALTIKALDKNVYISRKINDVEEERTGGRFGGGGATGRW